MFCILQTLKLPAKSWCLHIGAGELEEMETYNKLRVKPVWVEARPQAVTDAKCTWPFQKIIQACVSNETGKVVKFCEARDGNKSSLCVDSGVPLRGYRHMRTITVTDLLSSNKIPEDQFTLLVISTEGTELAILNTISEKMCTCLQAAIISFHNESQRKSIDEVLGCLFDNTFTLEQWVVGHK